MLARLAFNLPQICRLGCVQLLVKLRRKLKGMAWAKNMSNSAAGHDLNLSAAKPQFNGKLNGLAAPNLQTTKPKWNEMLLFSLSLSFFFFLSHSLSLSRLSSSSDPGKLCVIA